MAKSSVHVVPRDGEWACAARGPTATRRGTTPRQTRFARGVAPPSANTPNCSSTVAMVVFAIVTASATPRSRRGT